MTTEPPITVREVLRLLLAADSYPRLGNHDWREADRLEAAALQKAGGALPSSDDPPAFGRWLAGGRPRGRETHQAVAGRRADHGHHGSAARRRAGQAGAGQRFALF
jgi:hypothetical protein